MAAINKAIELLEKILEENYKLSEGYEIKPETRDEIESWLKWHNDLQKRADGVSPNENSGLNIPVVSKAVSLPLDKLSEEWTKVKEELKLKGNAGEMGNYYTMFMYGWRGRTKEGFWQ